MALQTSRKGRSKIKQKQAQGIVSFLILIFAAVFLFLSDSQTLPAQEGEMKVWFFDVGQGDATFLEFPTGEQVLIDAGVNGRILQKLGSVMSPLDREIDIVIATHPDADHIGGIADVFEHYEVGSFYETGARKYTRTVDHMVEAVQMEGAEHRYISKGEEIQFGDTILETLYPEETYEDIVPDDANELSLTFLLRYGETELLLPGDLGKEGELEITDELFDIDILKSGHHGSSTSSAAKFLNTIKAEVVIVSAGLDNRYGHPHDIVMKRYRDRNMRVLRTDLDGDVLLRIYPTTYEISPKPLLF